MSLLQILARVFDTKGYPDDKNPENWKTINHAPVHIDSNGNIDGGAGGKFHGKMWTSTKHPHKVQKPNATQAQANQTNTQATNQTPLQSLAAATTPTGITVKDVGNSLTKDLGTKHTQAVLDRINQAPENFKKLWDKYKNSHKFDDITGGKAGEEAYFDYYTYGVTLNLEKVAKETIVNGQLAKYPYQTFFHEFGHSIDHAAGRPSVAYKNGLFAQTIKKEVNAKIAEK